MTTPPRAAVAVLLLGIALVVNPDLAHAYGGPGSVISGIGTLLAAAAAVLAALFGFVWFPLKRLYAKLTGDATDEEDVA
jgi:drug/metabolite transporter (DMT)-like permease